MKHQALVQECCSGAEDESLEILRETECLTALVTSDRPNIHNFQTLACFSDQGPLLKIMGIANELQMN
jgi:hypothetical protein